MREWLALVLRILLILFMILALSDIVLTGIGYGGTSSLVLIIDNSGSMSAVVSGAKTRLDIAKEAAKDLLLLLGKEDRVSIVLLVEDITVPLEQGFTSDKRKIEESLGKIRETQATGFVGKAMMKATEMLENAVASISQEIHIFSDFQEAEWSKKFLEEKKISSKTLIFAHAIPASSLRSNVQIKEVSIPKKRILVKRNFPLSLSLHNTTQEPSSVYLHWMDDTGRKNSYALEFSEKQEKKWDCPFVFDTPGFHWIIFWLEGDTFLSDNHLATGFFCSEKKCILFVGKESDFFFSAKALSPMPEGNLTGLEIEFLSPQDFREASSKKNPVLVVARWDMWSKIMEQEESFCKKMVQEGANLLVLPSLQTTPMHQSILWFGAFPGQEEQSQEGSNVLILDRQSSLWEDIKEETGEILLKNLKAYRYYPLSISDAQAILGLEDDRALLSQKNFGKGKIFVSGLEWDSKLEPKFCNLPLKPGFVPMMQNMTIIEEQENKDEIFSLQAGERPPYIYVENIHLRSLAGSPLDWKGDSEKAPVLPRSGIYIYGTQERSIYLSVSSSSKESKEIFFTKGQIPAFQDIPFTFSLYENRDTFLSQNQRKRKGSNLYLPFLFIVLLLYCMEGWIVNPASLRRK